MNANEFRTLLVAASTLAIRFARTCVSDKLSFDCRYHVLLNQSFDGHATDDVVLYPEDDGREFADQSEDQAIALLCRDRRCPEWIEVSVEASNPNYSLLQLLCCGRFTANRSSMYYESRGLGPFGIKSPKLPPDFTDGMRFRLPAV